MFEDSLNSGTGAGGSGAASPAAPGSGVSAPPAGGSAAAPPAAPAAVSWETAPEQLRTAYQTTKAELDRIKAESDRWKGLGDYERVSAASQAFETKVLGHAISLGKTAGYTEDSVREAMLKDPVGTFNFLQQKAAEPDNAAREAESQRLRDIANESIKPIREEWDQAKTDKAVSLYDGEFDRLFKAEFADGLPDENREELKEIIDSLMNADPAALQRLKFQGQVSDVAKHFAQAKTVFTKRHQAYIGHERKGQGPPNGGLPKPNGHAKAEPKTSFGLTAKELFKNL